MPGTVSDLSNKAGGDFVDLCGLRANCHDQRRMTQGSALIGEGLPLQAADANGFDSCAGRGDSLKPLHRANEQTHPQRGAASCQFRNAADANSRPGIIITRLESGEALAEGLTGERARHHRLARRTYQAIDFKSERSFLRGHYSPLRQTDRHVGRFRKRWSKNTGSARCDGMLRPNLSICGQKARHLGKQ